jgi:DNA-binding SARP family transcriptional activator
MRALIVLPLRLLRWLASAAALAALLAGLPAALVRFVGWPLPHQWPSLDQIRVTLAHPLTGSMLQNVLACLVWVLWAGFLLAVATEALYAVRGLHAPRIRVFSPVQAVAALLVAGLSIAPASTMVITVPAVPALPGHTVTATLQVAEPTGGPAAALRPTALATLVAAPQRTAAQPVLVRVAGQHYTYQVERGDTLWHIAATWLGNPMRWPDIYQLNRAHYDRHGRMRHGDHIEPGWVLVLPDDATPPAGAAPAPPPAQPPPPPAPATPASPPSPTPSPTTSVSPSPAASPTASGVQPGDPGAVPAPGPAGTPTAAASPGPTATNASPPSRSPRANLPGISLPGGSWVDLGLAAAIAAAATLVWIQRRRRYIPRPPSPELRLDDPDLAPMPPVVTNLRRGLRHATRRPPGDAGIDLLLDPDQPDTDAQLEGLDPDDDLALDPDGDLDPDEGDDLAGLDEDVDADADRPDESGPPPPDPDLVPVAPALDHAVLQVWPPAGLGLTGPGGEAAARGFLVAALAADGLDEPEARGRVVIPAATLATLLGTEAVQVADTPRLSVTAGLPEALEVLEAATMHRTRLVYDHEVDTVAALRDADPLEEPLPPLLLIADATAVHQRARIASLLTQGQRLDIHGVLLGVWDDGNTVHVEADGTTSPADGDASRHGTHPADVGRLAVVDPTETADLLRTLAEAHTGQRQPAPPVETLPPVGSLPPAGLPAGTGHNDEKATSSRPVAADGTADPDRAAPVERAGAAQQSTPADAATAATRHGPLASGTPVIVGSDAADTAADEAGAGDADEPGDRPGGTDPASVAADESGQTRPGRAKVFLLGPPRIDNLPPPSRTDPVLRPQALELLVYLVTHGGSAGKDQILEDVLGDAPQSKAAGRLSTFVYSLRRSLKKSAGGAQRTYVGAQEEDYVLNRDGIDIDLWRMQDAIAAAAAATDPPTRIAALREAVACYTGPLAQGKTYEWIEPHREAVRRQAVDAHLGLVAELSGSDPTQAASVLQAAIGHDPYNDALYQQAMRLHARLGDVEAIRGIRKTLTRRLGEIDAEPSPDTLALADQLITDLQHRPRAPRSVRGDAA